MDSDICDCTIGNRISFVCCLEEYECNFAHARMKTMRSAVCVLRPVLESLAPCSKKYTYASRKPQRSSRSAQPHGFSCVWYGSWPKTAHRTDCVCASGKDSPKHSLVRRFPLKKESFANCIVNFIHYSISTISICCALWPATEHSSYCTSISSMQHASEIAGNSIAPSGNAEKTRCCLRPSRYRPSVFQIYLYETKQCNPQQEKKRYTRTNTVLEKSLYAIMTFC